MSRYEDNLKILELLRIANEQDHDSRFGQLLVNYLVIPRTSDPDDTARIFHEESKVTLERVKEQGC